MICLYAKGRVAILQHALLHLFGMQSAKPLRGYVGSSVLKAQPFFFPMMAAIRERKQPSPPAPKRIQPNMDGITAV